MGTKSHQDKEMIQHVYAWNMWPSSAALQPWQRQRQCLRQTAGNSTCCHGDVGISCATHLSRRSANPTGVDGMSDAVCTCTMSGLWRRRCASDSNGASSATVKKASPRLGSGAASRAVCESAPAREQVRSPGWLCQPLFFATELATRPM